MGDYGILDCGPSGSFAEKPVREQAAAPLVRHADSAPYGYGDPDSYWSPANPDGDTEADKYARSNNGGGCVNRDRNGASRNAGLGRGWAFDLGGLW